MTTLGKLHLYFQVHLTERQSAGRPDAPRVVSEAAVRRGTATCRSLLPVVQVPVVDPVTVGHAGCPSLRVAGLPTLRCVVDPPTPGAGR